MSEKEMDQMDREVIALVNERQTEEAAPEEIATAAAQPRNDVEDSSAETCAKENGEETVDWDAPLQEKNGKYCISKEDFEKIDAAVKKTQKVRNRACMAVCIVIMGVLFLASSRPELLNYIAGAGVISCSVMVGVCLARLVEVNR